MDQLNAPFSSKDAANILTTENIVWAFKSAIIDFVDAEIKIKENEEEEKKKSKEHDDVFSVTYHNPFLIPLKELLQLLEWEYRKPFTYSIDNELLRLKDAIVAGDLFDAVRIALQVWQFEFFKNRCEQEQPEYTVAYKQEMLSAIDMEIKYSLYNQNRETVAFRSYLANEQAITLILGWYLACNNPHDERKDNINPFQNIEAPASNKPTMQSYKDKSALSAAYQLNAAVAEAVRLHKSGDTWPDIVLYEIQEPLFKIAGSIPKATVLFCENCNIIRFEKALHEAIKRRTRKQNNVKKSTEKKKER